MAYGPYDNEAWSKLEFGEEIRRVFGVKRKYSENEISLLWGKFLDTPDGTKLRDWMSKKATYIRNFKTEHE